MHTETAPTAPETAADRRRIRRRGYRRVALDGRTRWARRHRGLVEAFRGELGRPPTLRDTTLIDSLAGCIVRLEQIRGTISRQGAINDEEHTRLNNVVARLLGSLGLRSEPAKPAPGLGQLLRDNRS